MSENKQRPGHASGPKQFSVRLLRRLTYFLKIYIFLVASFVSQFIPKKQNQASRHFQKGPKNLQNY